MLDFSGGPEVKNPPSKAGDMGSIPGGRTKSSHVPGQLSSCVQTRGPWHHNYEFTGYRARALRLEKACAPQQRPRGAKIFFKKNLSSHCASISSPNPQVFCGEPGLDREEALSWSSFQTVIIASFGATSASFWVSHQDWVSGRRQEGDGTPVKQEGQAVVPLGSQGGPDSSMSPLAASVEFSMMMAKAREDDQKDSPGLGILTPGFKSQFSYQLSGDFIPVPSPLWASLLPARKHEQSLQVFLSLMSIGEMGGGQDQRPERSLAKLWPLLILLMVAPSNVSLCCQLQGSRQPPVTRISLGPLPGTW